MRRLSKREKRDIVVYAIESVIYCAVFCAFLWIMGMVLRCL